MCIRDRQPPDRDPSAAPEPNGTRGVHQSDRLGMMKELEGNTSPPTQRTAETERITTMSTNTKHLGLATITLVAGIRVRTSEGDAAFFAPTYRAEEFEVETVPAVPARGNKAAVPAQ